MPSIPVFKELRMERIKEEHLEVGIPETQIFQVVTHHFQMQHVLDGGESHQPVSGRI